MKSLITATILGVMLASCSTEAEPNKASPETKTKMEAPEAKYPNIIRQKTDFKVVNQPFVPTKKMLATHENSSEIVFYESVLPPKTPGAPPHTHVKDDEFFYVAKGSLDVMSGDTVMRLEEGGFAALLPGTPHMFWNASDEETTIIMAVSQGHFEDFFDNVGQMLAELQPANMAEAQPAIVKFAAERGTIIDMSLMPEEAAPYYQPPKE